MSRSSECDPRVAVLASGRGSNFKALAEEFSRGTIPGAIVLLVTDNANAGAIAIAGRHSIPVQCIDWKKGRRRENNAKLLQILQASEIDFVLLAGFMRLLGPSLVAAYKGKILNIHPSLLPDFPGLNAQAQAVAAGVAESGCTVHFVDDGMDTGPIIAQRKVPLMARDTVETLAQRILEQEHKLYPLVTRLVISGQVSLEGRAVLWQQEVSL